MNYIDKTREQLIKDFESGNFEKDEEDYFISPSRQFRVDVEFFIYKSNHCMEGLSKVKIYDEKTNEKTFDFLINDDRFWHSWALVDGAEYLICTEDVFGGQTVIDLTHRKMASYSPGEDGFIWTEHHVSPNGKRLAVIGCFWACPYQIKIYDFQKPLSLPLKQIEEIELSENDEEFSGWINNRSFKMKNEDKERVIRIK